MADRTLSRQDLDDILAGACVLGCGGGGPLVLGHELVEDVVKLGATLGMPRLRAPEHVADDAMTAVSAVAGSPTASVSGAFPYQVATSAFQALDEQLVDQQKPRLACVLPGELGA